MDKEKLFSGLLNEGDSISALHLPVKDIYNLMLQMRNNSDFETDEKLYKYLEKIMVDEFSQEKIYFNPFISVSYKKIGSVKYYSTGIVVIDHSHMDINADKFIASIKNNNNLFKYIIDYSGYIFSSTRVVILPKFKDIFSDKYDELKDICQKKYKEKKEKEINDKLPENIRKEKIKELTQVMKLNNKLITQMLLYNGVLKSKGCKHGRKIIESLRCSYSSYFNFIPIRKKKFSVNFNGNKIPLVDFIMKYKKALQMSVNAEQINEINNLFIPAFSNSMERYLYIDHDYNNFMDYDDYIVLFEFNMYNEKSVHKIFMGMLQILDNKTIKEASVNYIYDRDTLSEFAEIVNNIHKYNCFYTVKFSMARHSDYENIMKKNFLDLIKSIDEIKIKIDDMPLHVQKFFDTIGLYKMSSKNLKLYTKKVKKLKMITNSYIEKKIDGKGV